MSAISIFIFVAFMGLLIFGGIASNKARLKRQAEFRAVAQRGGWSYEPENDGTHDLQFSQFSVFQQGSSRYAYNTMRGTVEVALGELPLKMGDYHYTTTSRNSKGRSRTTHHQFSYILLTLPRQPVTELMIRPEGFFDRIGSFLGFDDIDFESDEFSRKFHVKCKDKRFAYDLLHPRAMEYLMAGDPPTLELDGGYCCFKTRGQWEPQEFADRLEWLRQFFELWPRHLRDRIQAAIQP